MWADTILIVFISICTALLGEGLTWLLVYRTEKYQKLKTEVEKQSKRCKFSAVLVKKYFHNNILVLYILQWRRGRKLMAIHLISSTKRK